MTRFTELFVTDHFDESSFLLVQQPGKPFVVRKSGSRKRLPTFCSGGKKNQPLIKRVKYCFGTGVANSLMNNYRFYRQIHTLLSPKCVD